MPRTRVPGARTAAVSRRSRARGAQADRHAKRSGDAGVALSMLVRDHATGASSFEGNMRLLLLDRGKTTSLYMSCSFLRRHFAEADGLDRAPEDADLRGARARGASSGAGPDLSCAVCVASEALRAASTATCVMCEGKLFTRAERSEQSPPERADGG